VSERGNKPPAHQTVGPVSAEEDAGSMSARVSPNRDAVRGVSYIDNALGNQPGAPRQGHIEQRAVESRAAGDEQRAFPTCSAIDERNRGDIPLVLAGRSAG
jgi:hypothetical protein